MTTENLPESTLQALGVKDGSLVKRIRDGNLDLAAVVRILVPSVREASLEQYKVALPVSVTPKQQQALDDLPAKYGAVVPTERRLLTDEELTAILSERDTIDVLLKMMESRKSDGIKTIILNHIDSWLEAHSTPEELAEMERDKDGHYYYDHKVNVADTDRAFSWEIQKGAATFSGETLKALDAAGEIDHDLYLEITDPVRVVNEQKLLLAMSKKPEEVLSLVKAASSQPSKTKGSLYVRNQS